MNNDVVRVKLFPFSLKDKAKMSLNTLEPRSIVTWREIQTKFQKKYFLANRNATVQRKLMNFSYKPSERFKDLLHACPHHVFEQIESSQSFS